MDYVCNVEVLRGFAQTLKYEEGVDLREALAMKDEYRKAALLYARKTGCEKDILYCMIQYDYDLDITKSVTYFKDTAVTPDEIRELVEEYPDAMFDILYADRAKALCDRIYEEEKSKHFEPITLATGNDFLKKNGSRPDSLDKDRFAVGLYKTVKGNNIIIGTACCGRPQSKKADDGYTLEVNRLYAVDGKENFSVLYESCCRIAKAKGYRKVIISDYIESDATVPPYVIHDRCLSQRAVEEGEMHIGPVSFAEANRFIGEHHRHNDPVTGHKFAVGLYKTVNGKDVLIGTATCGRPVAEKCARDGLTVEITRVCVTEGGNSCSMLYGACYRIAKELGYKKIQTYTLETELGTSLKASNFILENTRCGGKNWSGERKRINSKVPEVMKKRWARFMSA